MNVADTAYWVGVLSARFPELGQSDLAYPSFGSLAVSVCARIRASGIDEAVLRAFELINEMAEVQSNDVDDLIGAGFLEVLGDHDECREAAEKLLRSRAKEIIRKGLLGWPHRSP